MKISIIGGGNIGTLMAAEFAQKKHSVLIYSSRPERWKREISVYSPDDTLLYSVEIDRITNDLNEAIENAEMLFITLPAFAFQEFASKILLHTHKGQFIGIVPGSGGAEFVFQEHIKKGCILFGLQRVHCIARLKEYGSSVYMLGRKSSIQLASIPASYSGQLSETMQELFDIPCSVLPNYLCVTLTPSNPILHTTRIYSLFKDYTKGTVYLKNPLFYEDWSHEASQYLLLCDAELQQICHSISALDLSSVKSLRDHYESYTVTEMTEKISSIPAFKGILSPMRPATAGNGWEPDFSSRYFTADFPYGLKIIQEIAELVGVNTPTITEIWEWYVTCVGRSEEDYFNIRKYGIESREELVDYYRIPAIGLIV